MMSITDSSRAPTPQRGPSTTPLPTFTRRLKKERVVLSNRLKSAYNPEVNRNDATIAVDMVLDLLEKCPGLRAGLVGMVYDMALSTADFDRLLDAGLIPVSKVPRTKTRKPKKGKIAARNLGKYAFNAKDGTAKTSSSRPSTARPASRAPTETAWTATCRLS